MVDRPGSARTSNWCTSRLLPWAEKSVWRTWTQFYLLILQLSFKGGFAQASLPVTGFRYSLMDPAPKRPGEEMLERDAG
ncbi:MAG: hypothetical protein JWP04_408, partial [Belnapia sp.]|nr:hypothetical protein [Belnapia sp.]